MRTYKRHGKKLIQTSLLKINFLNATSPHIDAPKLTLAGRRADKSAFYYFGFIIIKLGRALSNKTKLVGR